MGLACYYLSEEGGDKGRAALWFRNVADADMEHLNLGEFEHMKEVWQARAGILERMSSYYGYRIGSLDCMRGEAAYRDYWEDMVSLMAEELTDRDNAVMELKLYQEIVMQILDRASEFREEAGIRQSEMEAVLDEIVLRVNRMDSPGQQVRELKNNIVQAAEKARRTAASVYGGK